MLRTIIDTLVRGGKCVRYGTLYAPREPLANRPSEPWRVPAQPVAAVRGRGRILF